MNLVLSGKGAARFVLIGIAYFLAHEISFFFPDSQRVLSAVWPAGGIGLAALLLTQRRDWPATAAVLFVSGLAADLIVGRPIIASCGYMAGNVTESWGSAWLITHCCGSTVRFAHMCEVLALIVAAVFVNAGSAAIGAGTASLVNGSSFGSFWFTWWVSDGLGILLITPLIVTFSDFRRAFQSTQVRQFLELIFLLVVVAVMAWKVTPNELNRAFAPRPYMLIAPLAWAGLRLGRRSVALLLTILAAIAITRAVTAGTSAWEGAAQPERVLAVQSYLAFLASTALVLTAAYGDAKASELRLRVLGDNLPSGAVYQLLIARDGSRRFLYVSAGIEKLSGIPVEEILHNPLVIYNQVSDEDRAAIFAAQASSIRNMTVFRALVRVRHRDGRLRWMQLTSSPRPVSDGGVIFDGIQTDITEQKEAEDALQAANAELSAIHAHAPVTLLVVDEDLQVRKFDDSPRNSPGPQTRTRPGDLLYCQSALAAPDGCGSGPACGNCMVRNTMIDTLRNGSKHENVEAWLPVMRSGHTDMRCYLLFTGRLQIRESRKALVCVLDITDRKQAELELRNSEARFRMLTEEAPIAISISRHGEILFANPSFLRMFGFGSSAELEGRSIVSTFAPGSRDEVDERMRRRAQGLPVPAQFESTGARRDGSEFPILAEVIEMHFQEGPALVGFVTDLTARKKAEEERARLEQQLRQAQKMESIGRLAGGVAHDFNNLLTVINGYSGLLADKLDPQDRLRGYADQIGLAGERAARLTGQLLAFSRQEVIKPVAVNLNTTIAESEPMIRTLVGESIELSVHFDPQLGQALVDPAQVDQVILNLVANGRDAMPDGGRIEITTRNVAAMNRAWVTVKVSDTGVGMDEETREKIFEPFFTTKRVGKGTGLGLATVYGVMQQNAGWIDVRSAPGAGTTFILYFPRIEEQPLLPVTEACTTETSFGGETILLVEDEDPVRKFMTIALKGLGYKVLPASNGESALQVAGCHADPIDLLVTDVVMPGMNGKELADRLSGVSPETKVIFMSGYLSDVIAKSGVMDPHIAFLQKPVSMDALGAKIREVLR
jgi:two-component system cell cycle sensor histidine kinase/response regulator CckA